MCIFCELSSPFCCFQTAVDCQKNTRGLRPPSCFDAASAPACGVQGKMWELTIYKLEVLLGKSPNSIWWNSWFTELKDGDFPVRYVNLPEGNPILIIAGWWLSQPSEKYEFVSWDDVKWPPKKSWWMGWGSGKIVPLGTHWLCQHTSSYWKWWFIVDLPMKNGG